MVFLLGVRMVVVVSACVRLRDEKLLYAADRQPCRSAPPPPATYAAPVGREEPAQVVTHDIHE